MTYYIFFIIKTAVHDEVEVGNVNVIGHVRWRDLGINRFTWGSMLERWRERSDYDIVGISILTILLLPSGLERYIKE